MPRLVLAAIAALTLALAVGSAVVAPAHAFDRSANERTLLELVNQARVKRGLAPVQAATALRRAARHHSRDMLARDYFGHSTLAGVSVNTRARRAGYSRSGCSRWSVGEVIGWGTGCRGIPQSVFKGWMRSGAHRRIILSTRWRDVGIGCARGSLRGVSGAVVYTIDFGRRVQ